MTTLNANEQQVTIKYNGSVKTQAGFRSVIIEATAEKISEKRVQVVEVLKIDGETPDYRMSRTGAKRQEFNGLFVCKIESGKVKNISTLICCDED